ncbi:hypothetical protein [Streptodolium elevatio]
MATPIYVRDTDLEPSAVMMQVYLMDRKTGATTPFCNVIIPNLPGKKEGNALNASVTKYVRDTCGN